MGADDEWEQELKEAEDNLNLHVKELGKLKTEYDHNLNKLVESYYPKMKPLKAQVYHSEQVSQLLRKEIEWLKMVLEKCETMGEGNFEEARHMDAERREMLSGAEAMFAQAVESLQGLKKEDLAVMRKYEHPPRLILETMEAVMILRGEETHTWEDVTFLLCDTYFFAFFVSKAKSYDKTSLTDETLEKLKKIVVSPEFEPNIVAEASVPCGAMCQWIRALYEHAQIQRITAAKTRTLIDLHDGLKRAEEGLRAKHDESAGAKQKLEFLEKEFEQRRGDLKDRYDQTMNPLQERFLEAHHHYGETFCSPRRQRYAAGGAG
eukprot:TRINITY_DN19935_c0_g1_i1.p1 TRINITY_DN19935_c0_g1~~TRINITY_DN19935_c0_g1_i1.p1  ORF type:complete len:320 (+),score=148.40 TRINITY_DN19935_c0_g1_i1:61-1020(+)